MDEARVAEMTRINLSLHTLGRCVAALANRKSRREHVPGRRPSPGAPVIIQAQVPYRESKLTHLLRDSLGGNCRAAPRPSQICSTRYCWPLSFTSKWSLRRLAWSPDTSTTLCLRWWPT